MYDTGMGVHIVVQTETWVAGEDTQKKKNEFVPH